MPTAHVLLTVLLIGCLLTCGSSLFAAPLDEDDEEFRPGLVAEYRAGERVVTRVDPDVAFAWDEAAPDARVSAERFEATWRGFLLVRQEAKHRLHAFVQGDVAVDLDGHRVLHGSAKQPQWISGEEFVPGFAERPLVVTFRKTEPNAQLKLFWSSDSFGLEPLPQELLFHDGTSFNPNANGVGANGKNAIDKPTRAHADGVAVKHFADDLALIERGRKQFDAFRCGRCHVREGDAVAPAAPSLKQVAAGMTVEQIARRLAPALNSPDATALDRRMPHFRLTERQARNLAAFLAAQSESVKLDEAKAIKPKTPKEGEAVVTSERRGELLLRSVGCLACHRVGELGNSDDLPFAGPDLTHVGQRRSAAWLTTWLADPQRLNADHRMPVFALTEEERHLIVMALRSAPDAASGDSLRSGSVIGSGTASGAVSGSKRLKPQTEPATHPSDKPAVPSNESPVEAGRKLFVEHRCAACHRTTDPKLNEFARPKTDLSRPTDWSTGCLDEQWVSDDARQPIYLRGLDRAAIEAFLASRWDRLLSRESQFVRGTQMLEEKNCFACHPRHGGIGLGRTAKLVAAADKDLNGQAPSLVAPSLNAVGDKLLDEALSIAVRGERQPIRMPWLKVRMPKFKHSPDELAMLSRYFVEHDRIPPNALWPVSDRATSADRRSPATDDKGAKTKGDLRSDERRGQETRAERAVGQSADAQTHLAGQALTGVRGWSCIACHKIGDYEPKQVALGARGSDLKMLGKHIRPEFFFRWIASPLRVIPGVEMPQYNRPVAGVLDGNLSRQHAALWQALNDPNFQPPTNPANVEQLWVVNPGDRPRIIRDVFQLPKELGGGTVPRGFAVGFDNGHSFLFDAETMSIRQWTFGDFARQQVVGKRWYWEMAGSDLLRDLPPIQFAVRSRDSRHELSLISSTGIGRIERFEVTPNGVHFYHWLIFLAKSGENEEKEVANITVDEVIEPFTDERSQPARTGIKRTLSIDEPWDEFGPHSEKFELWFGRPPFAEGSGHARIEVTDAYFGQGDHKIAWGNGNAAWQKLIPSDRPGSQLEWTELPVADLSSKSVKARKRRTDRPHGHATIVYLSKMQRIDLPTTVKPPVRIAAQSPVTSVPGFDGAQLPLDTSIMPTGFDWHPNGQLIFSSLKGHVFTAADQDGDRIEDRLTLLCEGLCAPYGVLIPNYSGIRPISHMLVATKSALIPLEDDDGDGYYEQQGPDQLGWGFTDDYHEWASGPVQDSKENLYVGLASDYTDKSRPKNRSLWRGKVIQLKPGSMTTDAETKPIGHAFRYPTGIAINERDEVFVSDQQGVQNCFNEINYLVEGAHYGVPSTHEEDKDAPETKAAIQIPHPWTRSVNGICFLTGNEGYPDLKGHGIGCEYNGRFLIRFTTQRVGDVMQGAVYPFSRPDVGQVSNLPGQEVKKGEGKKETHGQVGNLPHVVTNFEGPLCCGVSPKGEIYIGSIADSGWAGGQNTGSIVKLKGNGQRPNGIREIRATRDGFDIEFFSPVDRARATNPEHYSISGYTRVWGGAYATPDSDRHRCQVQSIALSDDGKTVKLKVDPRKTPNYVYDISCRDVAAQDQPFFPSYGFITLHRIPK